MYMSQYAVCLCIAGCNLILNPVLSQQMVVLNLLSADGKSHVFDQSEDGCIRAEGCAAILLTWYVEYRERKFEHSTKIN